VALGELGDIAHDALGKPGKTDGDVRGPRDSQGTREDWNQSAGTYCKGNAPLIKIVEKRGEGVGWKRTSALSEGTSGHVVVSLGERVHPQSTVSPW